MVDVSWRYAQDGGVQIQVRQEIVSELFRLQPGTALNFSDLATTEKALQPTYAPHCVQQQLSGVASLGFRA